MYNTAGARRYREVNVQTASRGQILIALYEAAIRHARRGAEAIRQGDVVKKGKDLQRVAAIVGELASTLDHEVAPELCENLEALYFYMQERISQANLDMDPAPAEEVAELLDTLRSAWVDAVAQAEGREAA